MKRRDSSRWERVANWVKKHPFISLIVVLGIVLLPFILYIIFKLAGKSFWTAGDLLEYWGAVLGAAVTFGTIALAIHHFNRELAQRKQEEIQHLQEQKDRIQPYLHTESRKADILSVQKPAGENVCYIQYPANDYDESNVAPSASFEMSSVIRDFKDKGQLEQLGEMTNQHYCLHDYRITNAGAGNAVKVLLKIDGYAPKPPFSIVQGETKYFVFIFYRSLLRGQNQRKITIELYYSNRMSSQSYQQTEHFTLKENEENDDECLMVRQTSLDLITPPQEFNESYLPN